MREIGLGTFKDLLGLRQAQREIVEIFGTEERRQLEEEFRTARANTLHRSTMQPSSVGQSTKSLSTLSESQQTDKPPIPALEDGSFCVYDFILEQGADIVQRALHRFLLEQTGGRSEEHTSEHQSLMRTSSDVF